MTTAIPASIAEQLELADQLWEGRSRMLEPQDLPGRYGRVIKAIDHILQATRCSSVIAGGWAVWRHGFEGRLTRDVDVVLPAAQVTEFLRAASFGGFEVLPQSPGRWPKLLHKETQVRVDILPEGERPGTDLKPAPTTIRHPQRLGAVGFQLRYIPLAELVELKLGAGRLKDEADVVELIRANPGELGRIVDHLKTIHGDYVLAFERLRDRARESESR